MALLAYQTLINLPSYMATGTVARDQGRRSLEPPINPSQVGSNALSSLRVEAHFHTEHCVQRQERRALAVPVINRWSTASFVLPNKDQSEQGIQHRFREFPVSYSLQRIS